MICKVVSIGCMSGVVAVWSSLAGLVSAAPVTVNNHSFEEDVFTGTLFVGDSGAVTGWEAGTGRLNAALDPFFIGGLLTAAGAGLSDPLPGTAQGQKYAWMGTDNTEQLLYFSQSVGSVATDTVYTLTVAVGKRTGLALPNNWEVSLYTGEPVAGGGVPIAQLTNADLGAVVPGDNTFADNVLTWNSAGSAFVGGSLWIVVGSETGGNPGQIGFDNIRLDATPVPEPNALLLSTIGVALCGLIERNKRRMHR